MTRLATVLALVAGSFLAVSSVQAQDRTIQKDQDNGPKGPSIVGTWTGKMNTQGLITNITVTLRADGTYKTVYNTDNVVVADTGKYTFKDGVLHAEPDGGTIVQFEVTFNGNDQMTVKGAGYSITYQRK
jgi:hypothetical protein